MAEHHNEFNAELTTGETNAFVWSGKTPTVRPGNIEFTMTAGSVGAEMTFRLSRPLGVVRLMRCTVTLSIRNANTRDVVAVNRHCSIHPNQHNEPGLAVFVFDAELTGKLHAGTYEMQFKVERDSGNIEYYPSGPFINFAKLTVTPSVT